MILVTTDVARNNLNNLKNALLLSAYNTPSHHAWCLGLTLNLDHLNWRYLSLPARYFSWRIRGNPLTWSLGEAQNALKTPYDILVATSMVDLATLKGLSPNLATTPTLLYMHENQFAYPASHRQHRSLEPQMVNLYSALAADSVIFNSAYNQETFLSGIAALLKKLPDGIPSGVIETLEQRSRVLPVPIADQPLQASNSKQKYKMGQELHVIWNHRWEYDKGPDILAHLCRLIDTSDLPIKITIAGQSFRQLPDTFANLQEPPPSCLHHMGTLPNKEDYHALLSQGDIVLSTALHEFQGLAMLEATHAGCVPLAPDSLAYPEWVPKHCRFKVHSNPIVQSEIILSHLRTWYESVLPTSPDVSHYTWPNLANEYWNELVHTARANPISAMD